MLGTLGYNFTSDRYEMFMKLMCKNDMYVITNSESLRMAMCVHWELVFGVICHVLGECHWVDEVMLHW